MRSNRISAGLILGGALTVLLAACGGTTGTSSGGASTGSPLIHTASIMVGGTTETVLKNTNGLTLYYFTADTATTIACSSGCASTWPPLLSDSGSPTSNPALPGQLSVLNGANGNQVLYNGHPLYHYSQDSASGDANGQGIGGKWFAATPGLAAAAAASASATAKPGYPVY